MLTKILENILNSIESIYANKLRSSLSMLWIIIWVSSVIVLTAIWRWSTASIVSEIEELWTNILTISPGWWYGSSRSKATARDFIDTRLVKDFTETIDWLEYINPTISWSWQLVYSGNDLSATVTWIDITYFDAKNLEIFYWNWITQKNIDNLDKVTVIWYEVYTELFWTENPIWKNIKMWNNVFEVIWVISDNSSTNTDIFIPLSTASIRIFGQKYYSQLIVTVKDTDLVDEKEAEIDEYLQKYLNVTNSNSLPYRIQNMWDMLESINSITWILTLLLSWIAWISLFVWGIWVMNIMLVSVTERTKEIWIRKAIWAWKNDIIIQFLTEALTLSVIWWIIWILFSIFVSFMLNTFWVTSIISLNSVIISFVFSLAIWLIFWLLPAYKAAKLRPIDALRFE